MADMKVTLFGKFNIEKGGVKLTGLEAHKVQELFSYLLLFREHPRSRDFLCEALWHGHSTNISRKYLRQTLWRLQTALQANGCLDELGLRNENDWIQIRLAENFWLDVEEFEKVFNLVKGKRASDLSEQEFDLLETVADIYQGDLLEGWYTDWCFFERERFQTMHLLLLDKLVQFCELYGKYDAGLSYGMDILRIDNSYERAHRQLMRLYFLTGNRTEALHQYKRCEMALRDDLDVAPSEVTKQLYEQIRLDQFHYQFFEENLMAKNEARVALALTEMLGYLRGVTESLRRLERQIEEEISQ